MPFMLLTLFAGGLGGGGGGSKALQWGAPTGPLFEPTAPMVITGGMNELVKTLIAIGERTVKLNLYPGHGVITGHYRRSIHGEMRGSMHGIIHDSKVHYGPFLEWGAGSGGRFKGYRSFQLAEDKLNVITKAMAIKTATKVVKKLGG